MNTEYGHKPTRSNRWITLYVIFKITASWLTIAICTNFMYRAYSETIRQIKSSLSSPEKIRLLHQECNDILVIDEYKINSCGLNQIDKNKVNILMRKPTENDSKSYKVIYISDNSLAIDSQNYENSEIGSKGGKFRIMDDSKWRESLISSLNSIHSFYDEEEGEDLSKLNLKVKEEINNLMSAIDISGLDKLNKQAIKVYDSNIKDHSGLLLLTLYSLWTADEKKLNITNGFLIEVISKLHRYLSRLKLIEEMKSSKNYTLREDVPLLAVFEILTKQSN